MNDMIRVAGVVKESIVDGYGIRYVVFTQGCPHNCNGCHNPETHNFNDGELMSVESILADISSNPLICGITLSGGEPFCQCEPLIDLVTKVKQLGKSVWAFSGYTYEELMCDVQPCSKKLLDLVDVLIDGRFELSERSLALKFRGSHNQRIIDCNKTRVNNKVTLLC